MRASIGDSVGARDHQLMPKYQMEFEGRLRVSRIREIANDSRPARSPIIGIPILLADGTRMCIKVRRDLLQAACAKAMEAKWDAGTNRLILNSRTSHWKLISMPETYASNGIQEPLRSWANAQRKRVASKSASPAERKAKRIAHEIGILQRRRAKLGDAQRPVNPICEAPHEWRRGCPEQELAWHKGKQTRKELSRVFTVPMIQPSERMRTFRPNWKQSYQAAADVLGMESIPDCYRHAHMTRLTNGPSLTEYIRHPEKYIARMAKPNTRGIDEPRYGQESVESPVETMRRRRMEYLEEMSQLRALDTWIENLREVRRAILETETETPMPMEVRP